MNDIPTQIEDDQGASCYLLPSTGRHIDLTAIIEIHKLESKGLLNFEYRSYDDPPCILWRTTGLISLDEFFSHHRSELSPSVLAAILLELSDLLEALPGLPILKTQILWSPELIFLPRTTLSDLKNLAEIRLASGSVPSKSQGDAQRGFELAYLCVPWIPVSAHGDQSSNDVLGWAIGLFQRSLETLQTDQTPDSEALTPPYDLESIRTSVESMIPALLRQSMRKGKEARQKPEVSVGAFAQTSLSRSIRLLPAAATLCKNNRQYILAALALLHVILAVVVLLLFRHAGTVLPDIPKGDLIAQFPGILKPGMRDALQFILAFTLTADLGFMLYSLVQKKRMQQSEEPFAVSAGQSAADSKELKSSILSEELSLQPDDPISFAKLTISEGQRRVWRHSESKGLSEKGQAFITVRDYYVGSDAERADLFISHPGVTPLHARIFQRQGQFYITDLAAGSRTLLEGRTLVRFEDYVLPPSCTLTFGKLEMRFESSDITETPSSKKYEEGARKSSGKLQR